MNEQLLNSERNEYYREKSVFIEEIDRLWRLGTDEFTVFNELVFKVYSQAFGDNGVLSFT